MDFSYTAHMTKTSLVWQSIWGTDILVQKKVEKWPQDHYFSQKVLLVGTPTSKQLKLCPRDIILPIK